MDTTIGTTIMGETNASNYYRRSGFSSRIVRDRPRLRFYPDSVQIRPEHLNRSDTVHLEVWPELMLRKQPWNFWGVVLRITEDTVIFRQISGPERGTLIPIPFRYFYDGRVYQKVGISPDE